MNVPTTASRVQCLRVIPFFFGTAARWNRMMRKFSLIWPGSVGRWLSCWCRQRDSNPRPT